MPPKITHLVVNDIWIEDGKISVGATDNERWRWDTEEGASGADAKTLVFVTLTKSGKTNDGRDWYSEGAGFHCHPGEPARAVAMSFLEELFEVAWAIMEMGLDLKAAREKFFGTVLKKA